MASRAAVAACAGRLRLPEHLAGDPRGQLLDALGLVAIAAQFLVKEQRVQPLEPRLERRPAIALPEEPRIAQPRRHHALGVLRDQPLVLRLGVDHGEERFLQLAAIRYHREIVLVVHERGRQHLLRQREKRAIEEPGDDARELDEVGDLVEQPLMLLQRHPAVEAPGVALEIARDAIAALRVLEDDEVLLEAQLVFVEAADLDRAAGPAAGRQEAVAVGQRARRDFLHQRTRRRSPRGRS